MILLKLLIQYFDEIFDEKDNSKQLWYDQAHDLAQEFATVWLGCPNYPV